jgi:hypothetical protein
MCEDLGTLVQRTHFNNAKGINLRDEHRPRVDTQGLNNLSNCFVSNIHGQTVLL